MLSPDLRKDFPVLTRKINGKPLVYLDNAATTQKPRQVIDAISNYYEYYNSNVHRAVHTLSAEASEAYDKAHEKAAEFINANNYEEIVFTKNTTESLNLVANHFKHTLKQDDEIILSQIEHHSNIVPWQQVAKVTGAVIKFIPVTGSGELDMEAYKQLLSSKTKIVSVTHLSNVLGTINPVKEITELAHEKGVLVSIDGAQSVPHMPVDVKDLGCDFLSFSAHKMLGPTGIGVLYGKREILEKMEPLLYGGDMIKEVSFESASWNDLPWKFEAGTPNMAGAVGFSAAIDYLSKVGMDEVWNHEKELTTYATEKLHEIEGINIYGPENRGGVISFNIGKVHPHDVSTILDSEGIAVRGGHHCCMPLMKLMKTQGTTRASFYLYNTKEEINLLTEALQKTKLVMKV